jgi:flagellar basal-body rod protein FlgG
MRALYTAATGMAAQQMRIDNIANNLANVSTNGFKKARETFEDLVYQQYSIGSDNVQNQRPVNLEVGTGTRLVAMQRDFATGDLAYTGNQFDLAIGGRGFFEVTDMNGNERYTRAGRFQVNASGELVTMGGLSLQPNMFIPEDAERVVVNEDGTVQVTFANEAEETTIGQIQLVEFLNPTGLRSVGGNLFQATPESGQQQQMDAADGFVNLQQGFIESSNVDVAEELINMVIAQRAFELTSKAVEASDEMLQTVTQLKR